MAAPEQRHNCTSGVGGRPGPGPAGREFQEGERAEEREEEGKEEAEERSSQQAGGGRTSWCGGCQQLRERKTARLDGEELRSGERAGSVTREETWETRAPPPQTVHHLEDRGFELPLLRQSGDPWGFRGRAWAPPRRRGVLLC